MIDHITAKSDVWAGLIRKLQENTFLASLSVRLIPTGPFVLVNMVAGAASVCFGPFIWGTALGILPKILFVALITIGFVEINDKLWITLIMMALAGALIAVTALIRAKLKTL